MSATQDALNARFEPVVECACPNDCPRHGRCSECRAYHAAARHPRPPYCEREHKPSLFKRLFGG